MDYTSCFLSSWGDFLRHQHFTLDYLLQLLVADGILNPEQREQLCSVEQKNELNLADSLYSRSSALYPPKCIAESGLINQSDGRQISLIFLMQWLAAKHNLTFAHIDLVKIDKQLAASIISYHYAFYHQIAVLSVEKSVNDLVNNQASEQDKYSIITHIKIASSTPFNGIWFDHLTKTYPQAEITIVLTLPEDINQLIQSVYLIAETIEADNNQADKQGADQHKDNLTDLLNLAKRVNIDHPGVDEPIVKIVDTLLHLAIEQQASDIHVEPQEQITQVRFRMDGILQIITELPKDLANAVVSRLKVISNMDVTERRLPQDGRLSTRSQQGKSHEIRVSSLPTAFGEKMVLRLFNPDLLVYSFLQLGFDAGQTDQWQTLLRSKSGLILVTGPTGSGKTTTLYSSLGYLASPEINICTIEDPIELINPKFSQMQVNPAMGLNFAQGLRTILRQDPDVIMLGEIRDLETAKIAMQASLTGHLVLATLHTNDAISAVARLLDLGVQAYLIQATLKAVLAQRLLRKVCQYCAGKGCHQCCETGFKGRVAVYEFLQVDQKVCGLINAEGSTEKVASYLQKQGHRYLYDAGQALVQQGVTLSSEGKRVLEPKFFG